MRPRRRTTLSALLSLSGRCANDVPHKDAGTDPQGFTKSWRIPACGLRPMDSRHTCDLEKLTGLLPAGSSLCPYITLRSGSLRQRQDLNDGNALSYGMAMYRGLLYSVGKRYSSASPVNLSSRRSRTKAGERKLFAQTREKNLTVSISDSCGNQPRLPSGSI